ncbi:response regulator transcription factor [Neptunomonas qingdaonensis]|uniref:DNA-binding response regulator, OmpR family, contains REC and winged-helix (WHTH) domain n=1 Tax=Neptunomonas qingdaonensis TaxID=1045558 RepID=A0A1I2QY94_9GAMM|nr:response regulator transcription factor [Neptunomonas qingdaonensis]SFG30681.1 DNA-binding response regulator, OmpR family, contains REC and winged-helix (wHTH) domain [Neptunomonas qingdaonensis]
MKLLIAEDDLHIRQGLATLLESEGYECIEAADGDEAWKLYLQHEPTLVLLDIMMPKQDGYSVCRRIRQHNEQLPVIFITAKSEEIDQVLGLELGADDYIKKPFGSREVIARIRAVARRALRPAAGIIENDCFVMDDLQIRPSELRALRNNQVIELSLRDLKILRLLFEQRGKVVDRDALFNHCWGRDYFANSRTLDQHISKLRKVIELNPKTPRIISTVHGIGYRFDN